MMARSRHSLLFLLFHFLCNSLTYAETYTTHTPCPSCPASKSPSPVAVTAQYQTLSTCTPSTACATGNSKSCTTEYPFETYSWVSTEIPTYANGVKATTTITETSQVVTFSRLHSTSTSYQTLTYSASGRNSSQYTTRVAAFETVVDIVDSCPYKELGPLAINGYSGSGICEECESEDDGSVQQIVEVRNVVNSSTTTYTETWIQGTSGTVRTVTQSSGSHQIASAKAIATPAPSSEQCDTFNIVIYKSTSSISKAPVGYLGFHKDDATIVKSTSKAALVTLKDGEMVSDDGKKIGTCSLGFAVLEQIPKAPTKGSWKSHSVGQELSYSDDSFSIDQGSATFCVGSDKSTIFGQYTRQAPKCKPVKFIKQCSAKVSAIAAPQVASLTTAPATSYVSTETGAVTSPGETSPKSTESQSESSSSASEHVYTSFSTFTSYQTMSRYWNATTTPTISVTPVTTMTVPFTTTCTESESYATDQPPNASDANTSDDLNAEPTGANYGHESYNERLRKRRSNGLYQRKGSP